jgi:4-hydroxybenzoate polyprenyltransferase
MNRLHIFQAYFINFLKLIRFQNLFIIALTQYLVRLFLIGPKGEWLSNLLDEKMFWLTSSTLLMTSAGYIINDYYDIKIDTINRPDEVIVGRILRRRWVLFINILLNILGIFIGFYLSFTIGIINFSAGFFLWLYSNQLKRLPFIGNLTLAGLTAVALLVVLAYFPANHRLVFAFAVFAFFISLIREIIKDVEDMKGDASFDCQTLPVVWGIRRTKHVIYLLEAILTFGLLAFGIYFQDVMLIMYASVFVLLPLTWFTYRLLKADTKKDFYYLNHLCKLIMLGGVTTMLLI